MSHQENMELFQGMLDEGYHCSQCVLGYWAARMGIDEEAALRAASGLGMGVNHGDSCGAVTSTAIAIGLARGFSDGSGSGAVGGVEEMVRAFEEAFAKKNGSLLCRDLLIGGYDAADPDAAAPEGVDPWANCAMYCADAVKLAEAYLTDADLKAVADKIASSGDSSEGPNLALVAGGSGALGIALGALAMAVFTYERRRAQNERPGRADGDSTARGN
ncbi:MAG: C-GCAxxG-C-C family protein [Coriobacteriales bacterium]|nr:C-GCAxxG-C-C family protein [Coriobacteriales bacterium]